MATYEQSSPYILLATTLVLELLAFMTSHMVDSRNFNTLHEGLFKRCIYPTKEDPNNFNCLWWSADTFGADRASLQFVTILAFISIFLLGFTLLFGILSNYYKELRAQNYNSGMVSTNAINVILLVLIVIVYTFVYAGDTKLIPGVSAPLVFSWSYYLLFAALGTNILSTIFFLYNPLGDSK